MTDRWRVAVVGGGIGGLAAAWFLTRDLGERVDVTVLEASPRIGGKLRAAELAGVPVDVGAESLLNLRPEAVDLARAAGLADDVVHPESSSVLLWTRGALRPFPERTVMGIPGDLGAVRASGALTRAELARARLDAVLPRARGLAAAGTRRGRRGDGPGAAGGDDVVDMAVGPLVAARFGAAVRDRLVDPLLGGVYAGGSATMSLAATIPGLAGALRGQRSLSRAAAGIARGGGETPVFAGIAGGVHRLADAVAQTSGARIRTGCTVRGIAREPGTTESGAGFRLECGPVSDPELVEADAVVLAVPATPAAKLLASVAPVAADELAEIRYASVAIVSLVFPAGTWPGLERGTASGFVVPPVDGRTIKAATFCSAKWAWLREVAPEVSIVRCSVGRFGDTADLGRDDAGLIEAVLADLGRATGRRAEPLDAVVTRWGGALPQYEVGHRRRVEAVGRAVEAVPGIEVCGAAYDGVGIAACVAGARAAATRAGETLVADATMGR